MKWDLKCSDHVWIFRMIEEKVKLDFGWLSGLTHIHKVCVIYSAMEQITSSTFLVGLVCYASTDDLSLKPHSI